MSIDASSGMKSIAQTVASLGGTSAAAGSSEGSAEAIFEKMKADAIKNGWRSAEVKNIQGLIRSGSGQ